MIFMLKHPHTGLGLIVLIIMVAGWGDDIGLIQGVRVPETACEHTNQLCKWAPACAESHQGVSDLRNFLVTGTGSSGTAWVRASLRQKGFDTADESWGVQPPSETTSDARHNASNSGHGMQRVEENRTRVNTSLGRDGMVSWPARCWAAPSQLRALKDADEGHGLQLFQLGPSVRFRVVVHLVRHPLKAINSNRHFSDHLKQCANVATNGFFTAVDGNDSNALAEYCEWNWWRLQQWEYARIFTPIPSYINDSSAWTRKHHKVKHGVSKEGTNLESDSGSSFQRPRKGKANEFVLPPPGQPGGFLLWEQSVSPPALTLEKAGMHEIPLSAPVPSSSLLVRSLRGSIAIAALHWRTWNAQVASVADLTVRLEDGVAIYPYESSGSSYESTLGAFASLVLRKTADKVAITYTSADAGTTQSKTHTRKEWQRRSGHSSAPKTICLWLLQHALDDGWPPWASSSSIDCSKPDASSPSATNSHGGGKRPPLTWDGVARELSGAGLPPQEFEALQDMAKRYGYDIEASGN